jgi:TonB-dependent starch-binding outer membrane protein SusC
MKQSLFLLFLFMCAAANVFAQRAVSGKVSDGNGTPVVGASVTVRGGSGGTQTKTDGTFTISVPGSGPVELVITSTGFKPFTVSVDGTAPITATLQPEIAALEDVVVIGYGTAKRRDLTGSVSSVSARQLKDVPVNSAADALAGRLAGVQITRTEGTPNAEVLIRVRGGGSITQDAQPIYIIDGVQVENALSVISPQDIATIDVLKDASTTAIYGARGANGVVIITTKGGRNAKPTITYNGFIGVRDLANKLEVMSPYDFVTYQWERTRGSSQDSAGFASTYGTTWDTLQNYKNSPAADWQEEMFGRSAMMQTHNISLTGGTQETQYNLSLTSNKEEGVMLGSDFDRKLVNFKFDHNFSPAIKVGLSTRYNNTIVNGAGTSSEGSSSTNRLRQSIKYRPVLLDGADILDYDPDYAAQTNANSLALINPILLNEAEYRRNIANTTNLTGYVNINFNKYLSFRTTLGYDYYTIRRNLFDDSITSNSKQVSAGMPLAAIDQFTRTTINNSNVLSFTMDKSGSQFSENNALTFLVGQEIYEDRGKSLLTETRYFPLGISPERAFANMNLGSGPQGQAQPKPVSSEATSKLLSFFGRVNYALKDKYLLTASFRADGSTKFSPDNRWGYFPSGTIAWRISREKFMESLSPTINDLKLRVGYGEAGNNRIGDFLYLTAFGTGTQYGLNDRSITGYYAPNLANSRLVWEENISRNIGLDASFLNNRIQLTVDVYKNSSENLLVEVAVPANSGYTKQIQNVGSVSNKGVEFQINATPVQNKDFTWSANFNASFNKNRIESLGAFQDFYTQNSGWAGSNVPPDFIVKEGSPVGSVWGFITDGIYTVDDFNYNATTNTYTLKTGVVNNTLITAQPGTLKLRDINGDTALTEADRSIIGDATPKVYGGLNQQFTYKNFDMSIFINFQSGNDVYNANKLEFTSGYTINSNLLAIMNDRWRNIDDKGVVVRDPAALAKLNANAKLWSPSTSANSFYPHTWAIEDGSFIRLNNVTIGYTLPVSMTKRVKIQRLRFYVTGSNLAVWTNYSGYDPEVSTRRNAGTTPGVDYSAYPRSRSYIFGLNLSF